MRPTHKTTVPAPWLPLAWWQPARCPSPKRAALPGCGPTTWPTGTHGGVCKRNGGTPVEAWAHRWPRGSITPPSPHGYRPTATEAEGVGPAACQRRLMPLPLVKKGRCKAWQSSATKSDQGLARQLLLALSKRPAKKPKTASKNTVLPGICSTPISSTNPSTHAKQSLSKNSNIRPL